ncbi:hypothetical protein EDB85DRAFT_682169 [Lactarius pseudohatsudake]|nr:hypothetical protein EDB85DRAFT_682169 [Lactarius pseudohatsudake]
MTTRSTPHVPHDSVRDVEAQSEAQKRWPNGASAHKNDGINLASEKRQGEAEAAEYGDSSTMYWNLYASEAEIGDQKLVETLTADTNSMLILNSIFSSIIASFIIETYKALQPNNNQEAVCLLSQLVSQENSSQQSSRFCPSPYPGGPSAAVIRSNILLVISFFLAIMSTIACALIQQWCREYTKYASPRAAPHKRGRVRTYLFQGLERFYMRRFMYGVQLLLHTSMFLFFCGVSDYLHDAYPRVGMTSWYCLTALTVVYSALSIAPLIIGNCPYQTALTPPLRFGYRLLLFPGRVIWWCLRGDPKGTFPGGKDLHFKKRQSLAEEANKKAAHLDPYAMEWLFTDNDFSDTDMDKFLEGLPGYIDSDFTPADDLPKVLTAPYILRRIREHLLTCASASELSEQARLKRVSACVDSLCMIFQHLACIKHPENPDLPTDYIQTIIDGFNDKVVGLHGFCVRALAFQGFLTKCREQAGEGLPDVKFPSHLIPLYSFLSSQTKQQDTVPPAGAGVSDEKSPPDGEMWRTVLHDGPLINLTLLARAILLHHCVDPSTLSMCWKTLDTLRSELRVTRVDVSKPSLTLFNKVHEQTLSRVENEAEEPSHSLSPLLEVLDAVAGGRRLSLVFQDHPRYRSNTDLVFGKDRLRNPDIFRAFANCLPEFVTKQRERSVGIMEGLVCYDHLWTSLQVNLLNSLRSNTFILDKLRVFDRCCTVIDAAFALLENSPNVDWRSPDLGSLSHYFELFVTDCFQGVYIDRAIGFRVGLIKARFCKAVLTQFLDEFHRVGTVVFQSHWDVASLARVFYSLGVGDNADVEFWKSFVDGGSIGAEFVARAHAMLETAARDGPLLNFCKLGRLGVMAVPFKGSGLEDTDCFKKLLDLLKEMADDPRLPLTLASTLIWDDLGRLRDDVLDICARSNDEDKANMQALLEKINAVYDMRRPPSTHEHPRDYVQSQGSGNSPVVQSNTPSRGLIQSNEISSYVPTSTGGGEDPHDSSPAQEDDHGGTALTL